MVSTAVNKYTFIIFLVYCIKYDSHCNRKSFYALRWISVQIKNKVCYDKRKFVKLIVSFKSKYNFISFSLTNLIKNM